MAGKFICGTREIPVGVSEFSVTGLSLPFAPTSVFVAARQPAAEAPLVSAYVTGEATSDGFTVALSAPVEEEGYILDWQAFSDGTIIVDGDSLALGYTDFFNAVARFLGYDPDNLTQAQKDEVDMCVQSGVRNFYYPAAAMGRDWSFLKLDGALITADGVDSYLVPDGMGDISGQLHFEAGERKRGIVIVPYGDIESMRRRPDTGAPRFAAIVATNILGGNGQRKRIHFYPAPDREYSLSFQATADCGRLDAETRPYPLGGAAFSETVLESCLAVAEQRVNDEAGIHTQNFNKALEAALDRDNRAGAHNFGQMGDSHDW